MPPGSTLQDFVANDLYPAIIVITCLLLLVGIIWVIALSGSLRVVIGAVVPVVVLAFAVTAVGHSSDPVLDAFGQTYDVVKFAIGAAVAIGLLEMGRRLPKSDTELGPALYVMFLSFVSVAIIYVIKTGVLGTVQFLPFGFVIGGALHIMFYGAPLPRRLRRSWITEVASASRALDRIAESLKKSEEAAKTNAVPPAPPTKQAEAANRRE